MVKLNIHGCRCSYCPAPAAAPAPEPTPMPAVVVDPPEPPVTIETHQKWLADIRAWARRFGMTVETFDDMREVNSVRLQMGLPSFSEPTLALRSATAEELAAYD